LIERCAWCVGGTSFEVKIEADSNDMTEHTQDEKPRPHLCTVSVQMVCMENVFE